MYPRLKVKLAGLVLRAVARRIVEHRPYSDSYDLVKRHIISREEYNRIAGKVEAR